MKYRGRFAPSPTGPLHAGSLVAALASWLDAQAHQGIWLVRIEDIDTPRCAPGADRFILQQLAACGLVAKAPPVWQSQRQTAYQQALERLSAQQLSYTCTCSRTDILKALTAQGQIKQRHAALVYPGTCRQGSQNHRASAVRLRLQACCASDQTDFYLSWHDRRLGAQRTNLTKQVGDFVLKRADGLWTYQLAVVVDDAEQGITHVVRGADFIDSTAQQIYLQQSLGYATPQYLHTPLVLDEQGEKLSKQNGALGFDSSQPVKALCRAAHVLGLPEPISNSVHLSLAEWLAQATVGWKTIGKINKYDTLY
jgi:glutamyl-Q tRNA(Asp) synthetase